MRAFCCPVGDDTARRRQAMLPSVVVLGVAPSSPCNSSMPALMLLSWNSEAALQALMVRTSKGSNAGADDAKGCARVSLGPLRPSRTVIPLPASRYGMRHATSSHPPKFGLGTLQSSRGSHRFQACARRPAPAYDPSARCALAGPEFKPGPVGSDEYLPSTSRGKATACGGLFWATSRPS